MSISFTPSQVQILVIALETHVAMAGMEDEPLAQAAMLVSRAYGRWEREFDYYLNGTDRNIRSVRMYHKLLKDELVAFARVQKEFDGANVPLRLQRTQPADTNWEIPFQSVRVDPYAVMTPIGPRTKG